MVPLRWAGSFQEDLGAGLLSRDHQSPHLCPQRRGRTYPVGPRTAAAATAATTTVAATAATTVAATAATTTVAATATTTVAATAATTTVAVTAAAAAAATAATTTAASLRGRGNQSEAKRLETPRFPPHTLPRQPTTTPTPQPLAQVYFPPCLKGAEFLRFLPARLGASGRPVLLPQSCSSFHLSRMAGGWCTAEGRGK